MVESMIERVAKAIVAGDSGPEGSVLFDIHWREFGDGYMKGARTAIEAMREPTDAMVHAGVDANHTLEAIEGYPEYPESCANIYRAMIDAALNEQVSG